MALDVFDLYAKIGFDSSEYDKGMDDAEKKAEGFGSKLGGVFKGIGTVVGAGLAAAATGAAVLVKQSVSAYGEYEQLVGGVETLFSNLEGTVSAAPAVLKNAENAYKTAGMSANEYMETVTSFSAALIAGLENDYQKAAEVSDMAITDMSDNANKMGTAMESIQNAYQGFAKQNYTMLDNLKLGYGGTKSEMERLLADAEKFSGVHYDISNLSDVYNAIHQIQVEMGIAGTTAKEANETITGSIGQLGGAWTNLVAGFADSQADIPKLIDNVVDAAETSFNNLLPVAENAIGGIANFVEGAAPKIIERIPVVADKVVPPLLNAATSVVTTAARALPDIVDSAVDIAPVVIANLTKSGAQILPETVKLGSKVIVSLAGGIRDSLPELVPAARDAALEFVDTFTEPKTVSAVIDSGGEILIALADGAVDAIPVLVGHAPVIIDRFIDAVEDNGPKLFALGGEILTKISDGLFANVPIINGAIEVFKGIGTVIGDATGHLSDFTDVLGLAATAFIAYKAAAAISGVIDGFTIALNGATAAQYALNTAMELNPYGLIAGAIAGAVYLIGTSTTAIKSAGEEIETLTGNISELTEITENAVNEQQDHERKLAEVVDEYTRLNDISGDNAEKKERLKGLQESLNDLYGAEAKSIDLVNGSYEDQIKLLDDINERERTRKLIDVTSSLEEAQTNLNAAVAELSEGYFSYRDEMLGTTENALMDFADKYSDIISDMDGQGFTFNFEGNEDIDYVLGVLDDLMTAIEDTREASGELSNMYSSVYDASLQLKSAAANVDTLREAQEKLESSTNAVAKAAENAAQKIYLPTEALRQMRGEEAPVISMLGNVEAKTAVFGSSLEVVGQKAEETGKKVKEAFTFETRDIGDYRDLGVVKVLGQALDEEQEKADKIASTVFSASQEYVTRQTNNLELGLSDQIALWEKVQGQFIEGSEQFLAAGDKIIALRRKQSEEEAKTAANAAKDITFEARDIGEYSNLGIVQKLGEAITEEAERANKIAETIYSYQEKYITRQTDNLDLSLTEQLDLWEKVQGQFVEGSEQYLKAGDKIVAIKKKQAAEEAKIADDTAKADQKAYEERQEALEKYAEEVERINSEIADIQQKYADAVEDRTNDIYNSFGLFEEVPERILYSGADLTQNLENQIGTIEKFYGDVARLRSRGVSDALVQEIQGMGVGALDQLDALLGLSDEDLKKYDALANKKHELSADIAEGQLEGLKADTEKQIAEKMSDIKALEEENAKNLGLDFAKSIAEGIKEGTESIINAAKDAAAGMYLAVSGYNISKYTATVTSDDIAKRSSSGVTSKIAENAAAAASVIINVNGIQYQSFTDLARAISDEFQSMMTRGAAYGRV